MGWDGLEEVHVARVAWESSVTFDACVNVSSAVSHVNSVKGKGSSEARALCCS